MTIPSWSQTVAILKLIQTLLKQTLEIFCNNPNTTTITHKILFNDNGFKLCMYLLYCMVQICTNLYSCIFFLIHMNIFIKLQLIFDRSESLVIKCYIMEIYIQTSLLYVCIFVSLYGVVIEEKMLKLSSSFKMCMFLFLFSCLVAFVFYNSHLNIFGLWMLFGWNKIFEDSPWDLWFCHCSPFLTFYRQLQID